MTLQLTYFQNNYFNPSVDSNYITNYYTSKPEINSDDTDTKQIIEILDKQNLFDPEIEKLVKNGLEKTIHLAKFGLNDISKDIYIIKQYPRLSILQLFCFATLWISVLAAGVLLVLGLVWAASYVIPVPSPSANTLLTGFTACVITCFTTAHVVAHECFPKSNNKYYVVNHAIDNFDHDAIIAREVLGRMLKLIDDSSLETKTKLNSKIQNLYDSIQKQFDLRKTIDYPSRLEDRSIVNK